MRLRPIPALFAVCLVAVCSAPGCVMVQVGVTNPIPGLTTVAVAPFLNLSAERAVDGRRFALAYASELQKVPGFEVIPVGVTEIAMVDAKIDLNDVDDVLKLAKTLRVDAVVVGAITEYSPYYPPRIGLQVNWYSPRAWSFYPGIQTEPASRDQLKDWDHQRLQEWRDYHKRLDDAAAPETPVWERMYHSFQRWPGIRNLYGEPSLAWRGRPEDIVWRAQSPPVDGAAPPSATEPTAHPPAVETKKRQPDPPATQAEASQLVKVAHYQELDGMPGIIRLVKSTDQNAPAPSGDLAIPPAPLPGVNAAVPPLPSGGQPAPPAAVPPSKPPDHFPRALSDTKPGMNSQLGPFEQEPPGVFADPMLPAPSHADVNGPPMVQELPRHPIRDPALAPCPPQPNPYNVPQPIQPWHADPRLPLMAYTRVFDGSDANLVAALRDYVELNGDLRSGGWEGYLHRSEDYIRFTSYRMILEMLSLHGGEGKHRMIFKFRKYK